MNNKSKIIENGSVFGNWTVIGVGNKKTTSRIRHYRCICSCGNINDVQGSALRNGKSGGCIRCAGKKTSLKLSGQKPYNQLPHGVAQKNALFYRYKMSAMRRNIEFTITMKFFSEITKKNCHYCGKEPSQIARGMKRLGYYIYNGIDRVDNKIGYVEENCVPCCKFCNRAKDVLGYKEFIENIKRIYHHTLNSLSEPF